MKKQTLNNIAKKFFVGNLLAAALFLSTQNKVYANHFEPKKFAIEKSADNATVKYVGFNKENLLFTVKFDNNSGEYFTVSIFDEAGELLYKSESKEKQFLKTYALPKSIDVSKVTFNIKSEKANVDESFDVKNVTSVIVTKN